MSDASIVICVFVVCVTVIIVTAMICGDDEY